MAKPMAGRYAVVATTRPENHHGDSAMCINPKDPRTLGSRVKGDCAAGQSRDTCH